MDMMVEDEREMISMPELEPVPGRKLINSLSERPSLIVDLIPIVAGSTAYGLRRDHWCIDLEKILLVQSTRRPDRMNTPKGAQ